MQFADRCALVDFANIANKSVLQALQVSEVSVRSILYVWEIADGPRLHSD
jgi:hypothetical protein